MQPCLHSIQACLVKRSRLNKYLRPVSILLIQHLHVDFALLQVHIILFEIFRDYILDLREFLRILRINFHSFLMQLLCDPIHEFLYPLDPSLYGIIKPPLLLSDTECDLVPLPPHDLVGLIDLCEYPPLQLAHLHDDPVHSLHQLLMHQLLHEINLLIELLVVGAGFILETRRLLLEILELRYVIRVSAQGLPDVTDSSVNVGLGLLEEGLVLEETSLYLFYTLL
jgi:hypothetical protein